MTVQRVNLTGKLTIGPTLNPSHVSLDSPFKATQLKALLNNLEEAMLSSVIE